MALPAAPSLVKLICGMISADAAVMDRALEILTRLWGSADVVSELMAFDLTHYYDAEMGTPLRRRFVSFERLIGPDELAGIKVRTNEIEAELAQRRGQDALGTRGQDARDTRMGETPMPLTGGTPVPPPVPLLPRRINLDPGYLDEAKLVLASMKDRPHRVYLRDGVYAELTLMYRRGRWDAMLWTFPDYASGRYSDFFTAARHALRRQLLKEPS